MADAAALGATDGAYRAISRHRRLVYIPYEPPTRAIRKNRLGGAAEGPHRWCRRPAGTMPPALLDRKRPPPNRVPPPTDQQYINRMSRRGTSGGGGIIYSEPHT